MSDPITVELAALTAANWQQCADLTVADDQRRFLPANALSIAAAPFYPDSVCRAVYAGGAMVGFGMYGVEQGTGRVKLFRLMVAAPFQRRGLGTAAAGALLWRHLRQNYLGNRAWADYDELFDEVTVIWNRQEPATLTSITATSWLRAS